MGAFTEALGGVTTIGILAAVLLPDAIIRWGRVMDEARIINKKAARAEGGRGGSVSVDKSRV